MNFNPYWEGQEQTNLMCPTFNEWVQKTVAESGLKILSYDCYWQMNPEEQGTHDYFKNLRMFRETADLTGVSPWTTLLSVGHFRYRCPSENDLR